MSGMREVDLIVVGGGPAGLSAALYAGRARRSVAVIDRGGPRHAASPGVHNFLTREGIAPAEMRRIAWEQLAPFQVDRVEADVGSLAWTGERWVADCGEAGRWSGRAALLATGVRDALPTWPGMAEKWGRSVHFCPYCHGWEVRDQPLATFGHGEHIAQFGPLLTQWSRDVVVIADAPLSAETEAILRGRGIALRYGEIAALEGPGGALEAIRLADGARIERSALFLSAEQRQTALVRGLGLEMTPLPSNPDGLVATDELQRTSAPMLWAAGDLATYMTQVVESAAAGGRAAAAINFALAVGP